ncbi:hypothetical protein BM479_04580 [Escherichia coli]
MMSLWDALRMNMMISYQELVRTFLRKRLGYEVLSFSLQAHSLSQECIDKLDIFSLTICLNMSQYASPRWNI